ncbi:MAG: polysaccharide deacetylase family protein [Flavisolibacter sp.]
MDVILFDKCIRYISRKYSVVLLEDLVLNPNNFDQNKKYATIVFDDGYKDNIEYAIPILEKYNVKASFYVVTDCIDKNVPTWTHLLDYTFQHTKKEKLNLKFDFLPKDIWSNKLVGSKAKVDYVRKLKPALKKISHLERLEVLNSVQEAFDDVQLPYLMMNWNDVKEIRSAGHYIGSHTKTHCMLGTMEDEKEIKDELLISGQKIQQHLGYFPVTISYPVGSFNATTIKLSKEAGYKLGLAVKQEVFNPGLNENFAIPRIELYNEPWWKTRLRIDNVVGRLSKLLNRI